MSTMQSARFNMIEQQIRPWDVIDFKVLQIMEEIDRADFVGESFKGLAYADCQIPVAEGIKMLPPNIEGRLLQSLQIEPDDSILEVGCSNGYLTACLASLGQHVVTLQNDADILQHAAANVESYQLENIEYRKGTSSALDDSKTYDAIAVAASLPTIPDNLKLALAVGGRLFIVCGELPIMEAMLITRTGESDWQTESLFETSLPRLAG